MTYCKTCDGAGTISTGISEASSTQCRDCDGTGMAASAQQDERDVIADFPLPWRVVQANKGVPGATFKPVDIRAANNHTLFRVGNGDDALPLANLIVALSAQKVQADAERWRAWAAAVCCEDDAFLDSVIDAVGLDETPSIEDLNTAIDAAMSREQSGGGASK